MAPKTPLTSYAFALVLGFTWLSTVPPTVGLVGKLFGTRYLVTLFGLTLLSHQIGGFFGAWLGGIALASTGSYAWMWYADIALALGAAFINLPIKEAPLKLRIALAGRMPGGRFTVTGVCGRARRVLAVIRIELLAIYRGDFAELHWV